MIKDVVTNLLDVPFARMFVLAGIIFLMFAVLGKIEGKIDPGNMGRVGASVLGVVLMIIGVAMQYMDMRDSSVRIVQQPATQSLVISTVPVDNTMTKQSEVASTVAITAIKIVSGTYGRGCNGKAGNATQQLANSCEGKSACDHMIEPVALEGAPEDCARDFAAEWKCGSGSTVYSATLPANAGKNEKLHLACAG